MNIIDRMCRGKWSFGIKKLKFYLHSLPLNLSAAVIVLHIIYTETGLKIQLLGEK